MIQFNLLPDVKLEYIKSRRDKRTIMLVSIAVAGAALLIVCLLLFTVQVLQKQHLNNLSKDIDKYSKKLENQEELGRVLTVQNQLHKLPELHGAKVEVSRLKTYLPLITPAQVSYATIDVDTEANMITFSGSADSIKTINQFVDTLKFTKYTVTGTEGQTNAFSDVVLTSFGKDDKGARYTISFIYDPVIFDNDSTVSLVVPNIITTRSAVERPDENLLQPLGGAAEGVSQ